MVSRRHNICMQQHAVLLVALLIIGGSLNLAESQVVKKQKSPPPPPGPPRTPRRCKAPFMAWRGMPSPVHTAVPRLQSPWLAASNKQQGRF